MSQMRSKYLPFKECAICYNWFLIANDKRYQNHPNALMVQKKKSVPTVPFTNYQYAVTVGKIILVRMHPK